MPLTAQDIAEFRNLYRKHYGVELSEADAREGAGRLLRLVKAVCKSVETKITQEDVWKLEQSQSKTISDGLA